MEGVSDRTNANRLETMAENYNSSLADRQREIGAIDSYMSARDSDISKLSDDNGISIFTVGDEEQTAMFKDAENGLLQGDANQDVLSSQEGSLDESVSVPEGFLSENELVDVETAFSNLSDLHDDNLYAVQE